MSLAPGTKVGVYEVIGLIGVGGMGEVHRARDTRLGRDVALKILPEAFATDADRLARFEREAQVLASLNHPNIAAIYGIEGHALVMELVDGEDLSAHIARGPIPVADALPIARQIAEALEAAHEQGIIHRDLKPANIKIRADGTVKVLDFGLAKAIDQASSLNPQAIEEAAHSPTISLGGTRAGMILGTAAYMAPEQARGRAVDKRADVWAFGVVLYEMLTGRKAFPGDDVSDTLATVLKFEPDWSRLPAETPPSIRRLLLRCLAKDPKRRLRECGSALVDIHEALNGSDPPHTTAQVTGDSTIRPRRRSMLPVGGAVLLAGVVGVAAWAFLGSRATEARQPTRFTITLPESDSLPENSGPLVSLSPDGRTLVYRARRGTTATQFFRRPLDQFDAAAIPGTEGARDPIFFSPDGRWLGFSVDRTLKKIALAGGRPQTLSTNLDARGASWGTDERIVVGMRQGGLMQVSAGGGEATQLFKPENDGQAWYPQVLPGGKAVLFTLSEQRRSELHLVKLGTGERRTVLPAAAAGRVVPSGHLVFVRGGALWAVPFDLSRLEAIGTPVPVVESVRVEVGGAAQFDVSNEGSLVYIPAAASTGERALAFTGRDGSAELLTAPNRAYRSVALSPDGARVVVQIGDDDAADVWIVEVARGTLTRVTREPGFDGNPMWGRDGKSIVFASTRDRRWTLLRRAADGTGEAELLATFDKAGLVRPYSWTPDGGTLLIDVDSDIGSIAVNGKGEWQPLIRTPAFEFQPAVSPDGRWIAYGSDETGRPEVYLQRFPALGDRRAVSVGGGYQPTWSRDGRELFYLRSGPTYAAMRVSVQTNKDGRADIGTPEIFTESRAFVYSGGYQQFDVSPDGQRLLTISRSGDGGGELPARQIHVVLNWFEELKRLVPVK